MGQNPNIRISTASEVIYAMSALHKMSSLGAQSMDYYRIAYNTNNRYLVLYGSGTRKTILLKDNDQNRYHAGLEPLYIDLRTLPATININEIAQKWNMSNYAVRTYFNDAFAQMELDRYAPRSPSP